MKLRFLLCLALLATACGPQGIAPKGPAETKDRLSPERMGQLVEHPMELVYTGRLSEGQAEFDRTVDAAAREHGPRSVEVADLYASFGVRLFMEGSDESRQAARKYLRLAIPAFRSAFGNGHPEVAVALNDLASVEKILEPDDPPPLVEELLVEALRIREDKFGQTHHETRATMTYLANVYALPAWLGRDPQRFSNADNLYRRALRGATTGPDGDSGTNAAAIRIRIAKLYARAGYREEAIELVRQSMAISQEWPDMQRCDLVEKPLDDLAQIMAENGTKDAAQTIKPKPHDSACHRLLRPNWFERFLSALGIR